MSPLKAIFAAIALSCLCNLAFAQAMDDCHAQCARDKDSANASCPISTYDSSKDRDECLKRNQEEYNRCVEACPAPQPSGRENQPHKSA